MAQARGEVTPSVTAAVSARGRAAAATCGGRRAMIAAGEVRAPFPNRPRARAPPGPGSEPAGGLGRVLLARTD